MFGNDAWGVWLWECGGLLLNPGLLLPTPPGPCWVTGQGLTLLGCSWVVLPWEWEQPRAPTLLKPPLAWGHAESPGSAAGRGSALCPPSTKANLLRGRSADATLSPWLEDLERDWRSNEGPWENIEGQGWEKWPQHKWKLFKMLWQVICCYWLYVRNIQVLGDISASPVYVSEWCTEWRTLMCGISGKKGEIVNIEFRIWRAAMRRLPRCCWTWAPRLEAHPECNWNPPITHRD